MSPPVRRPIPRFVADSPQEGLPAGRLAERLAEEFVAACEPLVEEAGSGVDQQNLRWFPERTWGERVYVPVTAPGTGPTTEGRPLEYYGYVSFLRPEEEDPHSFRAFADFTDVTADESPEWQIDLSDSVVGRWRSDRGRGGDMTLVWGLPLIKGALAATAEIDGEVLDQTQVTDGRFTLIAVDAVTGFGDPLYVEIHLWDRRLRSLAAETLYEVEAEDEAEDEGRAGEAESSDHPEETTAAEGRPAEDRRAG